MAFGSSVPADDPRRVAFDCDLGKGERLILPVTCGNWSVPARAHSPKPEPTRPRVIVRETYVPGIFYDVPGVSVELYCPPETITLPSVSGMTPGSVQKSTTIIIDGH